VVLCVVKLVSECSGSDYTHLIAQQNDVSECRNCVIVFGTCLERVLFFLWFQQASRSLNFIAWQGHWLALVQLFAFVLTKIKHFIDVMFVTLFEQFCCFLLIHAQTNVPL
jgi:hypothetical protein